MATANNAPYLAEDAQRELERAVGSLRMLYRFHNPEKARAMALAGAHRLLEAVDFTTTPKKEPSP